MNFLWSIFGATLLEVVFHTSAYAIVVLRVNDSDRDYFRSAVASFGPSIPLGGEWGHVFHVNPVFACGTVKPPPSNDTDWVALVSRNNCSFVDKVINVQNAGYRAAIVYNVGSDSLVPMGGGSGAEKVKIPSVFVGATSGKIIGNFSGLLSCFCQVTELLDAWWENLDSATLENGWRYFDITAIVSGQQYIAEVGLRNGSDDTPDIAFFLIPFIVVIAMCVLALSGFLIGRCAVDYYRKRKARLPLKKLKRLPIKKFKKGTEVDVCAVCLDEYEEGDKLRVLPCGHEYHQKCIDPWLTKNRRTCPLCKHKVFPSDDSDSDPETTQEPDTRSNSERTPLLQTGRGRRGRRPGGARSRSVYTEEAAGAGSVAGTSAAGQSEDSSDGEMSQQQQQSSVEVHPCPRNLLVINEDDLALGHHPAQPGAERSDGAEEGAVGGVNALDALVSETKRKREKQRRRHRAAEEETDKCGLDIDDNHFTTESTEPVDVAVVSGRNSSEKREKKPKEKKNKKRNKKENSADDSASVVVMPSNQTKNEDKEDEDEDRNERDRFLV